MSTNFYWKDDEHIGKRSAAGNFCWDCMTTLCKQGPQGVHTGESAWYERCPKCGKRPVKDLKAGFVGSAAVELGFAKPNTKKPKGVRTCSSFTWAQSADDVRKELKSLKARLTCKPVSDEYGRTYMAKEFLTMLDTNCPLEYHDCVGKSFS